MPNTPYALWVRSWYSIILQGDVHTTIILVFRHISSHVSIYGLVSPLPELYLVTKKVIAEDAMKAVTKLLTAHPTFTNGDSWYLRMISLHLRLNNNEWTGLDSVLLRRPDWRLTFSQQRIICDPRN